MPLRSRVDPGRKDAMKTHKFIHILWQGNAVFNQKIVDLITSEENGFCVDEHLFVTPYKHIYEEIKRYPNVVLEERVKPQSADLINMYAQQGQWLFLHGMCGVKEAMKIKRKYHKQIIWRTWGHDRGGYGYKKNDFIKNAVKWYLNTKWKNEVRRFRMVGIANVVDQIAIEESFGKVPVVRMDYPIKNHMEILQNVEKSVSRNDDTVRVLVGHSGLDTDNHSTMIDNLKRFENEKMRQIFVLSYGDETYIAKVKDYIAEKCPGNAEILEQMMPIEAYTKLLAETDIAIFDGLNSYALSNISMLLYFKKKLYLNRNGILAKAFQEEQIPYGYTDEMEKISFAEFSAPLDYPDISDRSLYPCSYEKGVELWKELLAGLNQ